MNRRVLFFLLSALGLLTSCQYFGQKDDRQFGKNLTVGFSDPSYTLDWQKELNLPSTVLITNLMEGLVEYEPESTPPKAVPRLADHWQARNSDTQWVITLRSVNWSDGLPLTAEHFLISFKRLLNPATRSPYAEILFDVKNAKDFHEGKIQDFSQVGIKALDAETLEFELTNSVANFPEAFTHFATYPMRQENIDLFRGHGGKVESIPWIGAFKTTYISRKRILLAENSNYHDAHSIIKKIEALVDISKDKLSKLLKQKKIDMAFDVPADLEQKNLFTLSMPGFETVQLIFNCENKPFTNPVVRRVVGLSINKEELARVLPDTETLGGVIPRGVKGYESNRGLNFDPDMAMLTLKNSNMTSELKRYQYNLFVEDPNLKSVGQAIADQLNKFLGMNINIVYSKFDPTAKNPSMIVERVRPHDLDPLFYLGQYNKKSNRNPSGWKNPAFDDFLKKDGLSKAQHLLVEKEIPVVPLLSASYLLTTQGSIKDVKQSFLRLVDFKELTVESR